MPDLYRFSRYFEPIFLEGYVVKLLGAGLPMEGKVVRCVAVGAMPEYVHDFGALTAATWDENNTTANLEMNPMEMSQLRMQPMDDMRVHLYNSSPVQQWRTKNTSFFLPMYPVGADLPTLEYLWRASEFFVWEDNTPRFGFYSTFALATSRVLFRGWRFRFENSQDRPRYSIWISDWPSSLP